MPGQQAPQGRKVQLVTPVTLAQLEAQGQLVQPGTPEILVQPEQLDTLALLAVQGHLEIPVQLEQPVIRVRKEIPALKVIRAVGLLLLYRIVKVDRSGIIFLLPDNSGNSSGAMKPRPTYTACSLHGFPDPSKSLRSLPKSLR